MTGTTPVAAPPDYAHFDPAIFPGLVNLPAYVETAVALGTVVNCLVCGSIVGIGSTAVAAGQNAIKDGTGEAVADSGFLCKHHAGDGK